MYHVNRYVFLWRVSTWQTSAINKKNHYQVDSHELPYLTAYRATFFFLQKISVKFPCILYTICRIFLIFFFSTFEYNNAFINLCSFFPNHFSLKCNHHPQIYDMAYPEICDKKHPHGNFYKVVFIDNIRNSPFWEPYSKLGLPSQGIWEQYELIQVLYLTAFKAHFFFLLKISFKIFPASDMTYVFLFLFFFLPLNIIKFL